MIGAHFLDFIYYVIVILPETNSVQYCNHFKVNLKQSSFYNYFL